MPSSLTAPCSKPHASLGFTLLEILVALAVAGIVLSALFAVYARVMDAAEQVQSRAEAVHTARLGLTQLARDLDGLVLQGNATNPQGEDRANKKKSDRETSWRRFQGRTPSIPLTSQNATILSFPTTSGLDIAGTFPGRTLYKVIYTLHQSDREENLLRLARREVPMPYLTRLADPSGEEPAGSAVTIMEHIKDMSLTFMQSKEALPREEWGREGQNGGQQPQTPAAVHIELILQDAQGRKHHLELTTVLQK